MGRSLNSRFRRPSLLNRRRCDDGFVLLETLVAISLISVVMAAFTTFFVNSVAFTSQQRATQVATEVANSAVENVRGLPASDLTKGRDQAVVLAQFTAARLNPSIGSWLPTTAMAEAFDPAAAGTGNGATAAVPTSPVTLLPINSVVYTVNEYLGACEVVTLILGCLIHDPAARVAGTQYLRLVVAVTWRGSRCAQSLCTYLTSTLISAAADPLFNLSTSPPERPVLTYPGLVPGTQIYAVNDVVKFRPTFTAFPRYHFSISGVLPAGLNLNTSTGLISGVPSVEMPLTAYTVTLTDGFDRTVTATVTLTVKAALVGVSPPAQASVVDAVRADLVVSATGGQTPYFWTVNVANPLPPGLSLSVVNNQAVITGTPTGGELLPKTYPVVLTVTDSAKDSPVRTTTVAISWTISYPPFAAANPGPQSSTADTPLARSLVLTVTGGSGSFKWTGGGSLPAGLSLTDAGVISGKPTTVSTTSVTLTATDTKSSVTTGVFAFQTFTFVWTVGAPPTAPQMLTVVNGDGTANVTWTAPASNNGAPVISYTVTVSPSATCTSTGATSCSLSGLTNGVVYAVTVTATNSFGISAPTSVNAIPYPVSLISQASLWLDGADPTQLFNNTDCSGSTYANAGTLIGCWRDKSSKAQYFRQTDPLNEPTVGTWKGLTGALRAPNFADQTDVLNSISGTANRQMVFIAANSTNTQTQGQGIIDVFGSANRDHNVRIGVGANRLSPDGNDWSTNNGATPLNWANGIPQAPGAQPLTVITADQSQTPQTQDVSVSNTFSNGGFPRGVVGQVGEVIAFSGFLSDSQRQVIEDYLAHKWAVPIDRSVPQNVAVANVNNVLSVAWAAPATGTVTSYVATALSSTGTTLTCPRTATLTCRITGLTNGLTYTVTVSATNASGTATSAPVTAPPPLISAANTGMTLWLDGDDATKLWSSCDSGGAATTGAIGCWKDKSSLNNNFATTGSKPTVGTWTNGRKSPTFGNPSVVLTSKNGVVAYQTVFVAAKVTSTTGYDYLFGNAGQDRSNVRLTGVSRGTVDGNDWSGYTGSLPLNWTNGIQGTSTGIPGTSPLAVITSDQSPQVNNYSASVSNSGYIGNAYRGLTGQVGEVIAFSGILTTTQRRAVEEYLASKWGVPLAAQAPATPQAPTTITGVRTTAGSVEVSSPLGTDVGVAGITNYSVTSSGGQTCTASTSSTCTVSGLTAGSPYTFTATLTNSVGTGAPSASSVSVTA